MVRRAVRVILVDDHERALLFEDSDLGVPADTWWMTPGGGIDDGETPAQAAVREVAEETGCVIAETDLLGPLGHRMVVHGYSDQVTEQDEVFYLARVTPFEVNVSAHTEDEQLTIIQHRWWTLDELQSTKEWIWPAELAELWASSNQSTEWPRELGHQEESTVPDTQGARPARSARPVHSAR